MGEKLMNTNELVDRIFKDPKTKYELSEFETLGKPIHEIIDIYPKTIETGREAGKTKYYLESFVPVFIRKRRGPGPRGRRGKSSPEEIVRQLWVYKLINQYGYQSDEIDLEKSVQFGTEVGTKAADIIVYTDNSKETPKIIVECKKPKRKDGIEQLKSYMNAKGRAGGGLVQRQRQHYPLSALPQRI
jgi:type I restriction enzyme M protein